MLYTHTETHYIKSFFCTVLCNITTTFLTNLSLYFKIYSILKIKQQIFNLEDFIKNCAVAQWWNFMGKYRVINYGSRSLKLYRSEWWYVVRTHARNVRQRMAVIFQSVHLFTNIKTPLVSNSILYLTSLTQNIWQALLGTNGLKMLLIKIEFERSFSFLFLTSISHHKFGPFVQNSKFKFVKM